MGYSAKNLVCLFIISVIVITCVSAQDTTRRSYTTARVQANAPVIDGLLNDEAWKIAEWTGDFTQQYPDEGKAPTEPTQFKIIYDDKNLYIGLMMFDSEPDKIANRMSRRDGFEGDWVEINIDSYGDKRTAFSFTPSVSGVKGDQYISNDGDNWDDSWDPIWYMKTSIDDKGWVAEMRIPLSQLRFADKPIHTWGIQVNRYFFRNQENDLWQFVAQEESGWVRHFGALNGLEGIKPQKQLEVQPYLVAKTETFEKEEGNPFATGSSSGVAVGVDGKIGVTSNVTVDFTINPDFGQVEADPSQVNLTAYQVFFREQRPFFIEGNNILDFNAGQSMAGGFFNRDNLFYSRRIGRSPRYEPEIKDSEFLKQPSNTKILGALKLTGKNNNGFSFGFMESVTRKQMAEIDNGRNRRKEVVEPMTNYIVSRVQQDFNQGNTILGAMLTATNRSIQDVNLEFLHESAYTGGVDFRHQWKDRSYYVNLKSIFSVVSGSSEAILATQTSSERYFQRPDNKYAEVDSTRTSLAGSGSTLAIGKQSGKVIFQAGVTYRSPGLELNDVGFLIRADHINQWAWVQYRKLKPFGIFRNLRLNANQYLTWDFSGVNTYQAIDVNAHSQFKNFFDMGSGITYTIKSRSNADLRGGPSITYPGGIEQWLYFNSDGRKKIHVGFYQSNFWGFEGYSENHSFSPWITYRATNALDFSLEPNISSYNNQLQYVTTVEQGRGKYIVARINQKTFDFSLRITYNLNPNLSIQYWGQPFFTKGNYTDFKLIKKANADQYINRFSTISSNEISYDIKEDVFNIDEDEGGIMGYSIDNPNFDFSQFRSNMVVRWEYKPGSTLFLVWTQGRTAGLTPVPGRQISYKDQYAQLVDKKPHNVFLVKCTYRFVR